MNIYVCVKQVPDTEASILVKDGKSINEAAIKWIVSPYDEYAIEEALKLKEKTPGSTVTAVCLGPERVHSALRTALAMGADRAVHVESAAALDYQNTARALAQVIRADKEFGVIFMGRQAIDDDACQLHILLAEELAVPVATNVLAFALREPDGQGGTRDRRRSQGKDRNGRSLRRGSGQGTEHSPLRLDDGHHESQENGDQEDHARLPGHQRKPEQDPPAQAVGPGRKTPGPDHPRRSRPPPCTNWSGCCAKKPRYFRRGTWPTSDCILN